MDWQDPPADAGKKHLSKWLAVAQELRDSPGKWALVADKPSRRAAWALADNIRRGTAMTSFAPPGSFEAKAKDTKVWARYVGKISEDKERSAGDAVYEAQNSQYAEDGFDPIRLVAALEADGWVYQPSRR